MLKFNIKPSPLDLSPDWVQDTNPNHCDGERYLHRRFKGVFALKNDDGTVTVNADDVVISAETAYGLRIPDGYDDGDNPDPQDYADQFTVSSDFSSEAMENCFFEERETPLTGDTVDGEGL